MNNDCSNENHIAEILKVILMLQQNACPDNCLDSCDRPALGGGVNCIVCNTRPISLYLRGCCGNQLLMPTTKDNTTDETSGVFKIEKMDGNCATFRVLAPNPDTTSPYPYVSTNSVFTICLSCICMIRCLSDTYIECI